MWARAQSILTFGLLGDSFYKSLNKNDYDKKFRYDELRFVP